jgi:hypothetical protein
MIRSLQGGNKNGIFYVYLTVYFGDDRISRRWFTWRMRRHQAAQAQGCKGVGRVGCHDKRIELGGLGNEKELWRERAAPDVSGIF